MHLSFPELVSLWSHVWHNSAQWEQLDPTSGSLERRADGVRSSLRAPEPPALLLVSKERNENKQLNVTLHELIAKQKHTQNRLKIFSLFPFTQRRVSSACM